ncbi:MAG: adenylate/guanylate cyclase domain-containing protein [Ilumatobacteraceae bacterium]
MSTAANILVIDDDRVNRLILARALEEERFTVESAEDALRAIRILHEKPTAFDLILLDVVMPEMDGYDLLRYLKADPSLSRIPVVMVSALDDIASVVRCLELGADDYITKPFDPVLLRARMNASLAKKRLRDVESRYARVLEQEEARTERLLHHILPVHIATRLKAGERVIADNFEDVTVLFADLVGFTQMSSRMKPQDVVGLLNEIFSSFDKLAQEHNLEKIKTIGDAYLVVGGLLDSEGDHLASCAKMALGMLEAIGRCGEGDLTLRLGLHTGPVTAGVIGEHKFAYDLWGDTVNIASRLESHGVPGKIHVSHIVRDRLHPSFAFEERGTVDLKGVGPVHTFYLTG